MAEWLVVGASPSAPVYLEVAAGRRPHATTIATNAAIELFGQRTLHYYWLSDMLACEKHHDAMMAAQERGTRVVTPKRVHDALRRRGLESANLLVEVTGPGGNCYVSRDGYNDVMFSGCHSVQFALRELASTFLLQPRVGPVQRRELHVVGMDGYDSTEATQVPDHLDGADGPPKGTRYNTDYFGPFWQSVVEVFPEVEVTFYGQPRFELPEDIKVVT